MTGAIAARDLRIGDRLSDGSVVYDLDTSLRNPGHLIITSARNGASRADLVLPDHRIEVRRR